MKISFPNRVVSRDFCVILQRESSVSVCRWPASQRVGERKVRAAQGTPLPKVEAISDSRSRQKKTTALPWRGKGEKVR